MSVDSAPGGPSSTSRPLRVGLIGCGKMGMHHLRAIRALPGATVVGISDPLVSRESLEDLLPADALLTGSVEELLTKARPDVVHIVTPPESHATLALQAIHAGCHVYVEKPFTPSREEAAAVLQAAAERGRLVCAGHQVLFEHPAIVAREQLSSIGRLVHVESLFAFRMVRRTITAADQARDILPHAVYPIVEQLRAGSGLQDAPIEIVGTRVLASGDVYALLKLGDCTGVVMVTLSGRPVDQYQHLVGTNGWMRADYIAGSVTRLIGPGSGPGVLFTPYRRAWQTQTGATRGFAKLILRGTSYAGLRLLIERFYASIAAGTPSPLTPGSILDTVDICERIGVQLAQEERHAESLAESRVAEAARAQAPAAPGSLTLVTGGTGLLGKRVAEELRAAGIGVRVVTRRLPPWSARLAGVEYVAADLARPLSDAVLAGVSTVVHCAAETAGGKEDHERNSIAATQHVLEATARAGIRRFVHVSSLAVLKPGSSASRLIDESTPVDAGNLERGPYVWGKAASENFVRERAAALGVDVRVVRPGPLVDYAAFHPPGRLGRELGPWFVAIGPKSAPLSVCDVGTAARVLRSYVQDFASAPPMVNLVEAPAPSRAELARRFATDRPDLRFFWMPGLLLKLLSPPLKLAQRVLMGSAKPTDVYSAFASEYYRTDLVATVIAKAGPSAIGTERRESVHA